jgi:hypothetical protein
MAIGFAVIVVFVWQYFSHGHKQFDLILSALRLVGYGLAVSAAVELAYTFFTRGPDEALDPLILGVSSFTLIALSEIDPPRLRTTDAMPISLLALTIVLLFSARRFLLEVEDEAPDTEALPCHPTWSGCAPATHESETIGRRTCRACGHHRALVKIEAGHTIPTTAELQLISTALSAELFIELAVHKFVHQDEPGKPAGSAIPRWRRRLPGLGPAVDRRYQGGQPDQKA